MTLVMDAELEYGIIQNLCFCIVVYWMLFHSFWRRTVIFNMLYISNGFFLLYLNACILLELWYYFAHQMSYIKLILLLCVGIQKLLTLNIMKMYDVVTIFFFMQWKLVSDKNYFMGIPRLCFHKVIRKVSFYN